MGLLTAPWKRPVGDIRFLSRLGPDRGIETFVQWNSRWEKGDRSVQCSGCRRGDLRKRRGSSDVIG